MRVRRYLLFIFLTCQFSFFFFFNDTATTEIYTLSLHDALPIYTDLVLTANVLSQSSSVLLVNGMPVGPAIDRKSTRLNSSHSQISYAVFCLKKKNKSNKHLVCIVPGFSILSCTSSCSLVRSHFV